MEASGLKKYIFLLMCLAVCLLAAGCSSSSDSEDAPERNAAVDQTPEPEPTLEAPALPPEEPLTDALAPSAYQYAQLEASGGTLDYPAHWLRIPGKKTICFVEPVTENEVPARFAFTSKTLDKTPSSEQKSSQLYSFIRKVVEGYDSYEVSPLGTNASFLGDSNAYFATYTATKDGVTVKGYTILTARDKMLFVYHFRAEMSEYDALYSVMTRIRDSISLK